MAGAGPGRPTPTAHGADAPFLAGATDRVSCDRADARPGPIYTSRALDPSLSSGLLRLLQVLRVATPRPALLNSPTIVAACRPCCYSPLRRLFILCLSRANVNTHIPAHDSRPSCSTRRKISSSRTAVSETIATASQKMTAHVPARQPFAALDGPRLRNLTSAKNRQNCKLARLMPIRRAVLTPLQPFLLLHSHSPRLASNLSTRPPSVATRPLPSMTPSTARTSTLLLLIRPPNAPRTWMEARRRSPSSS